MTKIKDIHERLIKNPAEFSEIRLLVAKRTLAFFMAFYFTSFLFTVAWFSFWPFSLSLLAQITFHAYSLLIIVIGWFLYELAFYVDQVYLSGKRILPIIVLILALLFMGITLFAHLKPLF